MSSLTRYLLAAVLLTISVVAHGRGVHDLPPDAVIVGDNEAPMDARQQAAVASKAQAAERALARHEPRSAMVALDVQGDPLQFELAAAQLIERLQSGPDSKASRDVLGALGSAPLRVFKRHEETAADWFVPLIDVAGRARFALRMLDQRAAQSRWTTAWAQDVNVALTEMATAPPDQQQAAAAAVAALSDEQTKAVLMAAEQAPAGLPSSLWRALAERLPTSMTLDAALAHCSDADLLQLLPRVAALDDAVVVPWLNKVEQRPAMTSAALLALVPRSAPGSAGLARLSAAMDDATQGSSAAAAMAQRPYPDRITAISSLIDGDATPVRLLHIALALRIEGSPAAANELERLRNDSRLPLAAREELSR